MNNFLSLAPLLIITVGGLFILLLEVFIKRDNKDYLAYISVLFLLGCALVCFLFWNDNRSYFNGSLKLDNISLFFGLLLVSATAADWWPVVVHDATGPVRQQSGPVFREEPCSHVLGRSAHRHLW